jgi:sulfate permease
MLTFVIVPFLLAMFMAVNMGGSTTAPAFASAYGANLIKKHQISLLYGVMILLGAIFSGSGVSLKMGQGLLDANYFTLTITSVILLAVNLSLFVANMIGIPQSTSQASVMAISGAATYLQGLDLAKLWEVVSMWFVLPLAGFVIVWLVGLVVMPTLAKWTHLQNYKQATEDHPFFRYLVLLSCLFVSYSIGSNNVGSAAGPITSMAIREMGIRADQGSFVVVMVLSVLIVAPCFAIGSELMGYRGLRRTSKEIVQIGPLGGTLISVVTASLLLFASVARGVPTSLVQLNSVAFMAHSVNLIGWKATFSNPLVRRFFLVWGIAPVVCYILSFTMTWAVVALGFAGLD